MKDDDIQIELNGKCRCSIASPIPTDRVLHKLDEYFASDDYDGAERHLKYWIGEARQSGDDHGLLLLLNECIGFYRKRGDRDEAMSYADGAISLAKKLGLEDSVTIATAYVNAATVHCAFKEFDMAIPLYEKARELYEKLLDPTDGRLGGLYNNMALAVMGGGDHKRARELFYKALSVMERTAGGEPSIAITYCNLADLVAAERGDIAGEEEINEYLETAKEFLDKVGDRRDGEYAYACEKCAPTFGHYGFFLWESELADRARSIYEGH